MKSPVSDLVLRTEMLLERVSILTCVPSGALNFALTFNDWMKSVVRFLVAFLIHIVAVVNIFAEDPAVATGGLGRWRVGG